MKTAAKLKEVGFTEILTVECLLREMQVRKINQTAYDPSRQPTTKAANQDVEADGDANDNDDDDANVGKAGSSKKRKVDDETSSAKVDENLPTQKFPENQKSFVTAIPLLKMPGHTGFLTFATLPPSRWFVQILVKANKNIICMLKLAPNFFKYLTLESSMGWVTQS